MRDVRQDHREHRREHRRHHRALRRRARLGGPLARYFRASLQRRLFVTFVLGLLAAGALVATVMSRFGGAPWQREAARVEAFLQHRLEAVWDEPAQRAALVRDLAQDLALGVELADVRGRVLERAGPACPRGDYTLEVRRGGGEPLGVARACFPGRAAHGPSGRGLLALALGGLVLWFAAGRAAHRLAWPLADLARVAGALGEGNLSARAHAPHHATGEVARLALAFNDMAERIERQVKDQRELLAAVSHELRTPLGRLRVLTELLRERGGDGRTLDEVDREVVELDALVGELLASSRLDFGQLQARPLDAAELARRALARAGLDEGALRVDAEDTALVGDATLLGRALANLLENARRHAGAAELLVVADAADTVTFVVEDRGPGLPQGEARARLFTPFYRAERTGAGEGGTLGLGLALVMRIARAHGGEAFAEDRPGGGARVGLRLRRTGPTGSVSV